MTGAMSSITPQAQEAIELARNGNHEAALATAKKALNTNPDDAGLQLFVGLLHSRLLQIAEALPHFRAAIANSPNDPVARRELITALIANDELEEAAALLDQGGLPAAAAAGCAPGFSPARATRRRRQPFFNIWSNSIRVTSKAGTTSDFAC